MDTQYNAGLLTHSNTLTGLHLTSL